MSTKFNSRNLRNLAAARSVHFSSMWMLKGMVCVLSRRIQKIHIWSNEYIELSKSELWPHIAWHQGSTDRRKSAKLLAEKFNTSLVNSSCHQLSGMVSKHLTARSKMLWTICYDGVVFCWTYLAGVEREFMVWGDSRSFMAVGRL